MPPFKATESRARLEGPLHHLSSSGIRDAEVLADCWTQSSSHVDVDVNLKTTHIPGYYERGRAKEGADVKV